MKSAKSPSPSRHAKVNGPSDFEIDRVEVSDLVIAFDVELDVLPDSEDRHEHFLVSYRM